MDSNQTFYDPAVFDNQYEFQEYPDGNTVNAHDIPSGSSDVPTRLSPRLSSSSLGQPVARDMPHGDLVRNIPMVDCGYSSSINYQEGFVEGSSTPIESNTHFMRTGGLPTNPAPNLHSLATCPNDYTYNNCAGVMNSGELPKRYNTQDTSLPLMDIFPSSGTDSLAHPSDNAFTLTYEMGYSGTHSHQNYGVLNTSDFGANMAGYFDNDFDLGMVGSFTDQVANGSTSPATGEHLTATAAHDPETQESPVTAPNSGVPRRTARQVARQRNEKGYFHGLKDRDGQNEHNIGRHWTESECPVSQSTMAFRVKS